MRGSGGDGVATGSERSDPAGSLRRHLLWIAAAALIGAMMVVGPATFLFGRLWAEEASDFLPGVIDRGFGGATLYIYRGTLQIPTNWAVWIAARFALQHLPVITFWASVAVLLLLGGLFGWWARTNRVSPAIAALAFFAFLMIQSVDEVIGTSTNLQWLFSLCALLLLLMPDHALRTRLGWCAALIALAGLDGVPSCLLAPAFLLRAYTERSRSHALLGAILSAVSLVQLIILLTSPMIGRNFAFNPGLFLVSLVLHVAHVYGPDVTIRRIGMAFLDGHGRPLIVLVTASIGIAGLIGLGRMARSGGLSETAPFRLIALALLVTLINLVGVIGEPSRMAVPPLNGRYFVFILFCLILLLTVATRAERRAPRFIAIALLALAAGVGASRHIEALLAGIPQAPRWAGQIERCRARPDPVCRLSALPIESDGSFWPAQLHKAALTR